MTRGHRLRHRWAPSWPDLFCLALLLAPAAAILYRSLPVGAACATLRGPLDARFVGYVLEWGFLHLQGTAPGPLWSPPFFYPVERLLAHSDSMLAGQSIYAPLRWSGLDPSSALFAFHLIHRALTPVVTYLCLRSLRFGRWPSLIGAALFAWGWVRYFHYGHIQFAAGYVIPLFFTSLSFAWHLRRPWALVLVAWTFLFAWYSSLYTAVFLVLGSLVVGAFELLLPGGARRAARTLRWAGLFLVARRRQAVAIVALCVLALALIMPSALVYLEVQRGYGPASKVEVRNYQGDVFSWVRPPPGHLVLGRFHDAFPAQSGSLWEKRPFLGWLGFLGLLLPVGGWLVGRRGRRAPWSRPTVAVAAAGLLLIGVFSSYPGWWPELTTFGISLWEAPFWAVQRTFPGLGGLRVPTRISFVVSWFVVLCLATHLDRLARWRSPLRRVVTPILGVALLVEGLAPLPRIADRCPDEVVWSATERHLCPQIPRDEIGTVLFLPASIDSPRRIVQHTLAMHFSLACELNVVNGYSGRRPHMIAPLLATRHYNLPCESLREILDRAHERSGLGVLVHVDLEPPLGFADVPTTALAACLEPCLAAQAPRFVEQPGRPAELFVTDPRKSCREAPSRP